MARLWHDHCCGADIVCIHRRLYDADRHNAGRVAGSTAGGRIGVSADVCPIYLIVPIVENPDGPLAVVLSLIPFTSVITLALRSLTFVDARVASQGSVDRACRWFDLDVDGGRALRLTMLRYGKRVRLSEIFGRKDGFGRKSRSIEGYHEQNTANHAQRIACHCGDALFSSWHSACQSCPAVILLAVILINNNAGESEPEPEQATFTEGYVDRPTSLHGCPPTYRQDGWNNSPMKPVQPLHWKAGDIRSYYVIGSDYAETGHYDYYVNESSAFSENSGNPVALKCCCWRICSTIRRCRSAWQPLNVTVTDLERADESLELGPGTDSDNFLVEMFPTLMTLILYMVILIPAGMLVAAITDEKRTALWKS